MFTRKPIVAGKLYPSSFDKLENQIKICFLDKQGPGDFPVSRKEDEIIGVIVPNSNYNESGAISAWSFKELAESRFPKTYIIIGANNSNLGNSISTFTFTNWETPFGTVNVNKEIGFKLTKRFNKIINEAESFLENETIEVQLPFLQYVSKANLKELSFVPIAIKDIEYEELIKLANAIASLKDEYYFNLIISANINGDEKSLDYIKDLNSKEYYDYLNKNNLINNDALVLITGMECAKLLGASKVKLLNYYKKEKTIYGAFVFE